MLKTNVVTENEQNKNNNQISNSDTASITQLTEIVSESQNTSIDNSKKSLIQFSDLLPILKSCVIAILFIIFFSFGTIFVLYHISPDRDNNVNSSSENINSNKP